MRGWVTLTLAVLVGAMAFYIYKSDFSGPEAEFNPKATHPFDVREVNSLLLTSKDSPWSKKQKEILFTKSNSEGEDHEWILDYLGKKPADATSIESLLNQFSNLLVEDVVTKDVDSPSEIKSSGINRSKMKNYGLDSPSKIVEIGFKDSDPLRIAFGNKTTIGRMIFASITKSSITGIYTIDQNTAEFFKKRLWDWRQKRVGKFVYSDVTHFELTQKAEEAPLIFSRIGKENGVSLWKISSPRELIGEGDVIESYLSSVAYLNAESVAFEQSDSPVVRKIKSKKPELLIRVKVSAKKKESELIYRFWKEPDTNGRFYLVALEGREEFLRVSDSDFNRMIKTENDLRDSRILSHELRDQAETLNVSYLKRSDADSKMPSEIAFTKLSGKWTLNKADELQGWILRDSSISNLLDDLNSAKAEEFITGLKLEPELEMKLGYGKEKSNKTFFIYRKKNESLTEIYIKEVNEKEFLKLSTSMASKLPFEASFFINENVEDPKTEN